MDPALLGLDFLAGRDFSEDHMKGSDHTRAEQILVAEFHRQQIDVRVDQNIGIGLIPVMVKHGKKIAVYAS